MTAESKRTRAPEPWVRLPAKRAWVEGPRLTTLQRHSGGLEVQGHEYGGISGRRGARIRAREPKMRDVMHAWVFRNLEQLRRIYGEDDPLTGGSPPKNAAGPSQAIRPAPGTTLTDGPHLSIAPMPPPDSSAFRPESGPRRRSGPSGP